MELQDVINYARGQHKSDTEKQIVEKLVRLGAENVKYVREGKYSFNHDVNLEKELRDFVVGDIDDYDMGLAKHFFELGIKVAQNEHKSCTTDE